MTERQAAIDDPPVVRKKRTALLSDGPSEVVVPPAPRERHAVTDADAPPPSEGSLLSTALTLVEQGLPLFPTHGVTGDGRCTCGQATCDSVGKHPRVSGGFKAATLDEDQTRAWWTKWPTANLGMPTGVTSGMVVIDVDPRHGGNESLRVLQAQYGDLPPTRTHQTDGGGTHYLYRYPGSQRPIACRARILASAPGVDVRGDGGYIIVPPSRGALMRYAILDPREPVSLPEPGSCSCAVARRDPPFPLAEPGPGRSSRAAAT